MKNKLKFPIPTQLISNGEYDPIPQTPEQAKVEDEIIKNIDLISNEKGLSRRSLLTSTAAISIGLLALNKVYGPFFKVGLENILSDSFQKEQDHLVSSQFVFDMQTHLVRDDFRHDSLIRFAKWAAKLDLLNGLKPEDVGMNIFKYSNYLKEIFVDSDTDMALLSSAPFSNGDPLPAKYLNAIVETTNQVSKSDILYANLVVNPNLPDWMKLAEENCKLLKPLTWKLFRQGDPLAPDGKSWRLDDENLIYPFYELAMKMNVKTICIHKGLIPLHYENKYPQYWNAAQVNDLKKAAKDWPELNFVIFHSALRPFASDSSKVDLDIFKNTKYIRWTSDLIQIAKDNINQNIYAELGTSFASSCITEPEFCAAFLGTLINELPSEKIIWGTDSVWYGSPQWQIEAFRKFDIPDHLMNKMNWTNSLGASNSQIKNNILGLNAAHILNIPKSLQVKKSKFLVEWINKAQQKVTSRSNEYYGYTK